MSSPAGTVTLHREGRNNVRVHFQAYFAAMGRAPGAWLLLAFALLPVVPSGAVLAAYAGLLTFAWKSRFRPASLQRMWRTPFPWMAAFFLLHVVGLLWTSDIGFGLFDLQIKSPLLLLPLLVLFAGRSLSGHRDVPLFVFALVNAAMVIICSASAAFRIGGGSDLSIAQEISSSYWSLALHPSYFALYLSVAIAAWCLLPLHRWLPWPMTVAVLALLCIGVLLSASKMGWIMLPFLLSTLLVLRWRDRAVRTALMGMGMLFAIGIVTMLAFSSNARERVQEMWKAAREKPQDTTTVASSEVRRLTWATAWDLFLQEPLLGTGTGDIKNELVAAYEVRGYSGAAEKRLNAHGQYLQSAACLGILGLLLLVGMVLGPLVFGGLRDQLLVLFLLLNGFNWLVESMLEVQAGTVFLALLTIVLVSPSDHRNAAGPEP